MRIPYGLSNFAALRKGRYFYADKTPFIPLLESHESGFHYLLFLRPRRIGKSLLLSMLEHYYDVGRREQFDALFSGLWIHEHPTPERNAHLVLTLDFSPLAVSGGQEALERTFFEVVRGGVEDFLIRYQDTVPDLRRLDERLGTYRDPDALMMALLRLLGRSERKIYLFIDEYDNFANRLLSDGQQGLYDSVVRGTGFVRSFYAALKVGTGSGALARMFITGVSPILLDDLSSGFNIIAHVSQKARFNTMAGFTRPDVERAVEEFLGDRPELEKDPRLGDRAALLSAMEQYYNGYRFARDAEERVYNSDLVLYFLREIENNGRYPGQMLDLNVRTDYSRLQRVAMLSGAAGEEQRSLLEAVLTTEHVTSAIVEQFGSRNIQSREQLVSLFYYMGMLTFGSPTPDRSAPELVIPNRVIRELQWEYLALSLKEHEKVWIDTIDLESALSAMAVRGDIEPLLSQFRAQVVARLGSKDLRQFSEKVLKLMLLAYISQSRVFHVLSEKEFSGGYCDLFLGLSRDVPSGRFAWMLEVKYLKTKTKPADVERAVEEAFAQLERYTADGQLVPLLTLGKELKAGALVFVGAKDVLFRPWPAPPPAESAPRKKKAAPRAAAAKKAAPRAAAAKKAAPRAAAAKKAAPRAAAAKKPRRQD